MRTFIEGAGTEVEAKIGLSAYNLAPFHKLIGAKLVAFDTDPCKLGSVLFSMSGKEHK